MYIEGAISWMVPILPIDCSRAHIIDTKLDNNTTLTSLGFTSNKIGLEPETCSILAPVLRSNISLRALEISSNHLNTECGRLIVHACAQCPNLTSLNLASNNFDPDMGVVGALILSNTNLQS